MKIADLLKVKTDAEEHERLRTWRDSLRKDKRVLRVSIGQWKDMLNQNVYEGHFNISAKDFAAMLDGQMKVLAKRIKPLGVEV